MHREGSGVGQMNEDEKALAEQVRTARKARRGYTQQMLADDAGVSLGTVSGFEREVTFPQPGNLRAILRALDMEDAAPGGEETPSSSTPAPPGREELPVCSKCGQTLWPEGYAFVFDILGAYMDTLTPPQRLAFQREVTKPIREK